MRISDLEAFIKLYQLQSFTKTAQRIHLSQSDLSKRLRALQEELNVPLVDTSNRRHLKITPCGKVVYQHSVLILNQYRQMMNDLEMSRNSFDQELNIGTVPITGQYHIAECVSFFNSQYPQTKVNLLEDEGSVVINQLREGKIDGAILRDTQTNELSDVNYQKQSLMSDKFVVVMSRDNSLSQKDHISVMDLRDAQIASLPIGSGVYEPIVKLFREKEMSPNIFFQSTHIETITGVLAKSEAISILFKLSAEPFINDQLLMKPLIPAFSSQVQFVYPRNKGSSYQLRHLQNYLIGHLKNH